MLSQVLPGLREVRAPLAAGYVWLLFAWLLWGGLMPSRAEAKGSIARLYDLEPLVAGFGIVVVVSVSAYIVGSIMIDTQDWIGRAVTPERLRLPLTDSGRDRLSSLLPPDVTQGAQFTDADHEQLEHVARSHLARKKHLLKIRILDINDALHSEVDRPDAEARFRLALCAPLTAVILYLSVTATAWSLFALVVPLAMLAQSSLLTCQANDALLASLVARNDLLEEVRANIKLSWDEHLK